MKIISMYLPQYHTIPENDEWWGKGFTEWTNLRKAKPLFKEHRQPRIPLNDDYYDLSKPEVIINQMSLAKFYGVDVFAIYHYWFKGKKLLEKPVEQLINNESLPIEFCLSWANEPWTRTWDGKHGGKNILVNQDYGNSRDWKEHYEYLKRFFNHPHYLKKNNRPVLLIYDLGDIASQKEMFKLWIDCALKDGFDGIEIIATKRGNGLKTYPTFGDAVFDFEPFATMWGMPAVLLDSISVTHSTKEKNYRTIDYKKFCEHMVSRNTMIDNNYYGMFVGWDNSPRVGTNVQIIFENNTVENFGFAFERQYVKSLLQNKDYLFINAWNEWCESTYLEADSDTKYGYLEKIKEIKEVYRGF